MDIINSLIQNIDIEAEIAKGRKHIVIEVNGAKHIEALCEEFDLNFLLKFVDSFMKSREKKPADKLAPPIKNLFKH